MKMQGLGPRQPIMRKSRRKAMSLLNLQERERRVQLARGYRLLTAGLSSLGLSPSLIRTHSPEEAEPIIREAAKMHQQALPAFGFAIRRAESGAAATLTVGPVSGMSHGVLGELLFD